MKKKYILAAALILTAAALLWRPTAALASAETGPETEMVRLPIVMYHHISPEAKLWGDYVIPVDTFEADLAYLRAAGYESVSVSELLAWAEGTGTLPEKPCMITLDDAYETTGAYAAPLLEKYGFTGVVAVIGSVAQQYSDQPDHNKVYSHLSWEALAELQRSGVVELQYHTWDMHKLTPRRGCAPRTGESAADYRTALTADVERFRDACAANGVETVPTAAYPFGFYSPETVEILRELGFRAAFTCVERVNLLTGEEDQLMELGRYNRPYGKSSEAFFQCWESA